MENTKNSEYFKNIADKSSDRISTEFDFSPFDQVNIYLTKQVLDKQQCLWLKPFDNDTTRFYQPLIFAVAVWFFKKNHYDGKKTPPKIGDKYQKGRERYKVIDVNCDYEGMENAIKLEGIGRSNSSIVLYIRTLDGYTKLDNRTDNTNRDTFRPMLSFLNKTLGVQEIIPSFPHKFAIVATKKYFKDCFTKLDERAFPYTYVSKDGEETKNIPTSESMFFVASNYETIQKYIFDRDIRLDTIIFMENKYDDQLQQDIDRGYFQKCIFVGEQKPDVQKLLEWHWTLPEDDYFNNLPQGKIKPIRVNNEVLENNVAQFVAHIRQLEQDNQINLKRLYPYAAYIYPLIVLSDNSRLKNRIDDLLHNFQIKSEQVLGEEFSTTGADYKEINKKLIDDYRVIIEQIDFENNAKTQALKQIKKTDYLLMPKGQTLYIWQEEIKCLGWLNTKVISFSKLKSLEEQSNITVLALEDYDFYVAIRNSKHHIKWLLYASEHKRYKNFSTRYKNQLIEEYNSRDRKKLIGIDYTDDIQRETIDENMERIFDDVDKHEGDADKHKYKTNYQDHITKRIIFTDDSSVELSANTTVILIDKNGKPLKYKVGDLIIGDKVRIYKNQHKEVLFNTAVNADKQGKFKDILDSTQLWKDKLIQYCTDDEKIEEIAHSCKAKRGTVSGWLDDNSKTKFPQHIEPLNNILGNDYQKILKNKKNYNRIMRTLGRDLSDEITDYIITNEKGKLLEQFDDVSIYAISRHNRPIREIKQIEII